MDSDERRVTVKGRVQFILEAGNYKGAGRLGILDCLRAGYTGLPGRPRADRNVMPVFADECLDL